VAGSKGGNRKSKMIQFRACDVGGDTNEKTHDHSQGYSAGKVRLGDGVKRKKELVNGVQY